MVPFQLGRIPGDAVADIDDQLQVALVALADQLAQPLAAPRRDLAIVLRPILVKDHGLDPALMQRVQQRASIRSRFA